jgi:hypothetical protein
MPPPSMHTSHRLLFSDLERLTTTAASTGSTPTASSGIGAVGTAPVLNGVNDDPPPSTALPPATRKATKCSNCQQFGHNRRTCRQQQAKRANLLRTITQSSSQPGAVEATADRQTQQAQVAAQMFFFFSSWLTSTSLPQQMTEVSPRGVPQPTATANSHVREVLLL